MKGESTLNRHNSVWHRPRMWREREREEAMEADRQERAARILAVNTKINETVLACASKAHEALNSQDALATRQLAAVAAVGEAVLTATSLISTSLLSAAIFQDKSK